MRRLARMFPWSVLGLAVLFLSPARRQLHAQVASPTTCSLRCPDGSMSGIVRCDDPNDIPPCLRAGGAASARSRVPMTPSGTVFMASTIGTVLGGLAGSFSVDPSGGNFWLGGAALGGSSIGLITLAVQSHRMSTSAVAVYSLAGGAALGWGVGEGMYQYGNQGTQQKQDALKRVPEVTAGTAAVVFTGFMLNKLAVGGKLQTVPPIVRALANVRIDATARRFGASVQW